MQHVGVNIQGTVCGTKVVMYVEVITQQRYAHRNPKLVRLGEGIVFEGTEREREG